MPLAPKARKLFKLCALFEVQQQAFPRPEDLAGLSPASQFEIGNAAAEADGKSASPAQLSGTGTVAGALSGAPPTETGPTDFDSRRIRLRRAAGSP